MAVLGDSENNSPRKNKQTVWWQPAIVMFLKLSVWIAGPVIAALYLGKWLDRKFDTAPWLFLLSMAAAFLISMISLIKNTLAEYRRIEEQSKKEKLK